MIKLQEVVGLPNLQYHLDNKLTLSECVYRYSSDSFIQLFAEARQAFRDGKIVLSEQDTSTVYYLNPISTLQELNKNSLVRSSNISATPPTVNPTKLDYELANTGFVKTDNGNVKPSI